MSTPILDPRDLTPREDIDACNLLLSTPAFASRPTIASDVIYDRMATQGLINLGKSGMEQLTSNKFLTQIYKRNAEAQGNLRQLQATALRQELIDNTLPLEAVRRESSALFSMLATGLDWNMGQAAKIARPIHQMRNFIASQIEQAARARAVQQSDILVRSIRQMGRASGLRLSSKDIKEIAVYAVEIGSLDRKMRQVSPSAVVLADSRAKLQVLTQRLRDIGFAPADIDRLYQLGTNVTYAFDEPRKLAQAVGMEVESLTGLGWLHRVYTEPMVKYLQDFRPDVLFESAVSTGKTSLKSLLAKSRETVLFLVQDKVALASILGLTPADHVFVPQTPKRFTIKWKATADRSFTSYTTNEIGLRSWKRANPGLTVHESHHTTWSALKADIATKAGIPQTAVDDAAINAYVPEEYIAITNGNSVEIIQTAKAAGAYTLVEDFTWAVGRATDINDLHYINPAYQANVPVVRTSKKPLRVLAERIRKEASGAGKAQVLRDVKVAEELGDEAAMFALAEQVLPDYGMIIQNNVSGEYIALNFDKVPDLFVNTALPEVDALFDPKFAYGLLDYLRDTVGGVSSHMMDMLVDTGVLAKVPMSVPEFYEYFVDKYRLPFTRPSDVVDMNFNELWLDAANKLKGAAANSMVLTKLLSGDGVANGWLIPRDIYRAGGSAYSGYVQVGSDKSLMELLDNVGLGDRAREISNMYVHPDVARQLKGALSISTSPTHMAQIGSYLHNFLRVWQKSMLLTMGLPKYVLNNTLDPLITSASNGGDLLFLPVRIGEIYKFLQNGNLDHVDDTILKYLHPDTGAPLTQRQATQLFLDNYLHGFASGASAEVGMGTMGNVAQSFVDWGSLAKHMAQWATFDVHNQGAMGTAKRAAEALGSIGYDAVMRMFAPQGYLATVSDKTIQLNHFLGLLRPIKDADSTAMRRRATSLGFFDGYATSSADLWEHMDRTFINPYNSGSITRALGTIGAPMFASYILKTPMNVAKMATRRPVQFYNFMRMWSIMEAANQKRSDIRDIELAEYQQEAFSIGEWQNPAGDTERMLLWDSYNNLWNTFDTLEAIQGTLAPKYTIHRIDDIAKLEDSAAQQMTREWVNISNPALKHAYRVVTGKNPVTGRAYKDEVGAKRPSLLIWNTDPAFRDTVFDFFPFIRLIDTWNPGDWFGTAPVLDEFGNVIVDGKLGLNDVERYPIRGLDRLKLSAPEGYTWLYRGLTAVGFSATIVNVTDNVENNLRKLDFVDSELSAQYAKMQKEITMQTSTVSPAEVERRLKELEELASFVMLIKLERAKWQYYMNNAAGTLTPAQINEANDKIYRFLQLNGKHPLVDQYNILMQQHAEEFLQFRNLLLEQANGEG